MGLPLESDDHLLENLASLFQTNCQYIHEFMMNPSYFSQLQAQMAIKADKTIKIIGGLLDEADGVLTKGMMDAESAVLPPHKAASHSWSPELAERQRKAALGRKYAVAKR